MNFVYKIRHFDFCKFIFMFRNPLTLIPKELIQADVLLGSFSFTFQVNLFKTKMALTRFTIYVTVKTQFCTALRSSIFKVLLKLRRCKKKTINKQKLLTTTMALAITGLIKQKNIFYLTILIQLSSSPVSINKRNPKKTLRIINSNQFYLTHFAAYFYKTLFNALLLCVVLFRLVCPSALSFYSMIEYYN